MPAPCSTTHTAPRNSVRTHIDIDAPASVVWSVLTDLPGYAEWNPLIPNAVGQIALGERLVCRPTVPGIPIPLEFHLTVSRCEREREFAWVGKVVHPRLASGEHVFRLEPGAVGGVRLIHTEIFHGVVAPLARRLLESRVVRGFRSMDLGLRRIAEAKHQATGDTTCH